MRGICQELSLPNLSVLLTGWVQQGLSYTGDSDLCPWGQNKTVTLHPSTSQEASVGGTQTSGVDAALFQQGLGYPLWEAHSLSHRVFSQSHPAQDGVQGWAVPSLLSPRVLRVPLNALVPKCLPDGVWPHQGWGLEADWDRLAPELSRMLPWLPLAWSWGRGGGQARSRILVE